MLNLNRGLLALLFVTRYERMAAVGHKLFAVHSMNTEWPTLKDLVLLCFICNLIIEGSEWLPMERSETLRWMLGSNSDSVGAIKILCWFVECRLVDSRFVYTLNTKTL